MTSSRIPNPEEVVFIFASKENDKSTILQCIHNGINLNHQEPASGRTAFHYACNSGNTSCVDLLLKLDIDHSIEDKDGHTACDLAFLGKHYNIIEMIELYYNQKYSKPLLHIVAALGHCEWLRDMLNSGDDIDVKDLEKRTALHHACVTHQMKSVRILLDMKASVNSKDCSGKSALHLSVISGNHEAVRVLLNEGADRNQADNIGCTALHYACQSNNVQCLELLIQNHTGLLDQVDENGRSALHFACQRGNLEIARRLKEAGASTSIRDSNRETAADQVSQSNFSNSLDLLTVTFEDNSLPLLHNLCVGNHYKWLETILETGLKVDVVDKKGRSPLHYACLYSNRMCIDILLKYGANKDIIDKDNKTPCNLALENGFHDIAHQYFLTSDDDFPDNTPHGSATAHNQAQQSGETSQEITFSTAISEQAQNSSESNEGENNLLDPQKLLIPPPCDMVDPIETTTDESHRPVHENSSSGQTSQLSDSQIYDNTLDDRQLYVHSAAEYNNEYRGIFLLINNYKFNNGRDIPGFQIDNERLIHAFTKLNYKVEVFENITVEEINEKCNRISAEDHTKSDSFVCAILSHGNYGYINDKTFDRFHLSEFEDIFSSSKCPTLAGKPKVLLVEACRGDKDNTGIQLESYRPIARTNINQPIFTIHPNTADFLFLYSTGKGYKSFVHRNEESLFIKLLCENISIDYPHSSKEIYQVYLRMNSAMRSNRSDINMQPSYQVCEFNTKHDREFYFSPILNPT